MKRWHRLLPLIATAATSVAFGQTTTEPVIQQDFKQNEGGWTTVGQTAKVSVSHDPAVTTTGASALKVDYDIAKGQFNAIMLPTAGGTLAKAKSFKFKVRADTTTAFVVALQEQDGGRYVATCLAPKDQWQTIELSASDFILAQDKDDPKDPDGKLDMDQVMAVTMGDLSQIFVQGADQVLADLVGVRLGSHAFYVEDFVVTSDPVPPSFSYDETLSQLDTFVHPQLCWFGIGGVQMSRSPGVPMDGPGLKVSYKETPGKPSLAARSISPGILTGKEALTFDVISTQAIKMIVQIEGTDGSKFNEFVDIPSGHIKHARLKFSDFRPTDDSAVKTGLPDLSKMKTLIIMDASGLLEQANQSNTFWINNFKAIPPKPKKQ